MAGDRNWTDRGTNRRWGRFTWRRTTTTVLAALLGFQTAVMAIGGTDSVQVSAADASIKLLSQEPITTGATFMRYVWQGVRGKEQVTTNANVIRIDLHNPHVKLDVMTGVNQQTASRETVLGMAQDSNAVAGINGDFFSTAGESAPIGPEVSGGTVVSSPTNHISGMYAFGITTDRKPVIDTYRFSGQVTATGGASYPLAGINQSYEWYGDKSNVKHSHSDAIYLYTDAWSQVRRGNDGATTPTEILVENGSITRISIGAALSVKVPKGAYILRAAGKATDFVKQHLKIGDTLNVTYNLIPGNPNLPFDFSSFQMLIGGHTILVDQGKASSFSRDVSSIGGNRSRTGIGYSQDGRYAYLVTVDQSGDSAGMSLHEFQNFLIGLGIWKAINLDGGGSTQMVSRPLGDFDVRLANTPEFGTQRKIVNGVGLYSLAPEGELSHFIVRGSSLLFIGEKSEYQLKGYDQYFNPVDVSGSPLTWSTSDGIGVFQGSTFIPQKAGNGKLTVVSGKAKEQIDVRVAGFDQVASLHVVAPEMMLARGSTFTLSAQATMMDGSKRTVPAELVQWQFFGFTGKMEGGKLTVDEIGDSGIGQLIASYDGFHTLLTVPAGVSRVWSGFEPADMGVPITFDSYPREVRGGAKVAYGFTNDDYENHVIYLQYDFSKGTGTKAAYAVINHDEGIDVESTPLQMQLRVKGDNSLNWVRAEVLDKNGKMTRIDITRNINWYGWKTFNIDLSEYDLAYPIKLKRIYVANPEENQDEREVYGEISIDDISFLYAGEISTTANPSVKLTVNQKTMTVGDESVQLDQVPVIVNGSVLVPIRFVTSALGGQVFWDNMEKRLTALNQNHLIDLWTDKSAVIANGERAVTNVPPRIINGRTMVPLRLISETFGWKVSWNNEEKSAILE